MSQEKQLLVERDGRMAVMSVAFKIQNLPFYGMLEDVSGNYNLRENDP